MNMSEAFPHLGAYNEDSETLERGYDKEAVESAAMAEAEKIFHERGLHEVGGYEQAVMLVHIMEELAEQGNENRHVVEALARMAVIVEADNRAHEVKTTHSMAAAALGR